ncbi:MAG: rhodanese-like domain-containing protein [Myxococcota bacterium]
MAWLYPLSLAALSIVAWGAERLWPWRKEQRALRRALPSDFFHLVFNGHFLGVILYGIATHRVLPWVEPWLHEHGVHEAVYARVAAAWPVWLQIVVALVVVDFLQWCVHNLLHRVPWLWETHKVHHSVKDGEMDFIVSFRFQWTEVVIYRSLLYVPLAFFGFGEVAVMTHAIFGTFIGHLNHANLDLSYGPLRYVFNSPRMHLWHHNYDGDEKSTVNFGIIFSTWDWLFGTAKMPAEPPPKIGFAGVETFPTNFLSQAAWPLGRWLGQGSGATAMASLFGLVIVGGGFVLASPPRVPVAPLFGEVAASSQPARGRAFAYAIDESEATARLSSFGNDAFTSGFAHPEHMVSADEVAASLQSPRLVLLDVRPRDRFEAGHLPSARQVGRDDYSSNEGIPGLSLAPSELQDFLRRAGVKQDSVVVLYGDNGPEPYRLWWTLRTQAGFDTRVLDGGLVRWKALGHPIVEGKGLFSAPGDIEIRGPVRAPQSLWRQVEAFRARSESVLVDTRSRAEYIGTEQHKQATRGGRIPGALHLDWYRVLDNELDPRLLTPPRLTRVFSALGISADSRVITSCQSGTRSAAVYFALWQLGAPEDALLNYDGSWAEYSRLAELPAETGEPPSL